MGSLPSDDSSSVPADFVAKAFVEKYYMILHSSPEHAHHFYQDPSVLGRPGPDGTMNSVTTMKGISDKIMSLDYKDSLATIVTVYAQASLMGGVIVGVTGSLMGKDNVKRNFSQTFFLAQQDKGYYVLNDFLHFTDVHTPSTPLPVHNAAENTSAAPLTEEKETAHVPDLPAENHTSTPTEATVKVSDQSEIKNSSVEEVAVSEPLANKSQNDAVPATNLASNAQDVRKTSYASILAKEIRVTSPVHVPATAIVRVATNSNQQARASAAPSANQQARVSAVPSANKQPLASAAPSANQQPRASAAPIADQQPRASAAPNANQQARVSSAPNGNQRPGSSAVPNTNQQPHSSAAPNANQQAHSSAVPNANQQPRASAAPNANQQPASGASSASAPHSDGAPQNSNAHAEAKGIYIGGLPMDITYSRLEAVVNKFGPVKQDGIQIRKYEDGFTFGFVEFESSKSAHNAVETHTIAFGDKEAYIDFKRSNMQGGSNRGRFTSGRGGYRNGNFRSRENYGEGRGNGDGNGRYNYGNRDGNGRYDYGNRGYVLGQAPPRGSFAGRDGEANRRVYQNGGGRAPRQGV